MPAPAIAKIDFRAMAAIGVYEYRKKFWFNE